MREEQFWEIINASRKDSSNCESQVANLHHILAELPTSAILEFDQVFRQKVIEAYRWDLWGVVYLINGGCSDDSFEYFLYWLVGKGSDVYRKVLKDPQAILEYLDDDEEIECEGLMYASSYAYEEIMGKEMPVIVTRQPNEPIGEVWQEKDLASLFPKIAEKYL